MVQAVDEEAEGLLLEVVLDLRDGHLAEDLALPEDDAAGGILLEVGLHGGLRVGHHLLDGEGGNWGHARVVLGQERVALGVLDEVVGHVGPLDELVGVEVLPLDGEPEEPPEVGPAHAGRALNAAQPTTAGADDPPVTKAEAALAPLADPLAVPVDTLLHTALTVARVAPLPALPRHWLQRIMVAPRQVWHRRTCEVWGTSMRASAFWNKAKRFGDERDGEKKKKECEESEKGAADLESQGHSKKRKKKPKKSRKKKKQKREKIKGKKPYQEEQQG